MALFKIERQPLAAADVYRIGFADPASNDDIVKEVARLLDDVVTDDVGGSLALLNGPASLPVAVQLAHALLHRYSAIGVFDPKLQQYVVAVSHGSGYTPGQLIDPESVQ
jgi:hypothetical protein